MINAAEPVTRATGGGNKPAVLAPRQNGANVNSRKRQTEGMCVFKKGFKTVSALRDAGDTQTRADIAGRLPASAGL